MCGCRIVNSTTISTLEYVPSKGIIVSRKRDQGAEAELISRRKSQAIIAVVFVWIFVAIKINSTSEYMVRFCVNAIISSMLYWFCATCIYVYLYRRYIKRFGKSPQ